MQFTNSKKSHKEMITDLEKKIYNTYLRVSRQRKGLPYRPRKDFSKFEENKNYMYVKKIANLLKKNKNVGIEDYFEAPYVIYDSENEYIYPLKFYASMKAIGVYKIYIKKIEDDDPDSDRQIEGIKKSLRFVYKYCLENNLSSVDEYFKKRDGHVYAWMKHYTNLDISLIFLLESELPYDILMSVDKDIREMMMGGLEKKFFKMREKYKQSSRARNALSKGMKIINSKVSKPKEK